MICSHSSFRTIKHVGEYQRFECKACGLRWSIGARKRGRKAGVPFTREHMRNISLGKRHREAA